MFRRRQQPTTPAAPPAAPEPLVPLDALLGSTVAGEFSVALSQRRFGDLLGLLGACPTVEERAWAVQAASDDSKLFDAISAWRSAQPESGLAVAAFGAAQVIVAWEQRGGGRFADLRPEVFSRFVETLREADQTLHRAAEMSPTSPLPWMALLRSGRGLQISSHELRLRYDQAMRRNAPGLDPHLQMLQGLCKKWGGSHEEMFEFAREVAANSPAGSPLKVVLVLAHIERAISGEGTPREYMASVADEIHEIGRQSVEHPTFVDSPPDGARARNMMCCAYWLCGDQDRSLQQRAAIGSRLSAFPWNYFGKPQEVFRAAGQTRPVAARP